MKIGILEFGANYDLAGTEILKNVIEYAKNADSLGFSRFWVTEHHSPNLGWSNPEMLLPALACATREIKIGLAGTLASVHSPYRLFCSFKLLSTLYPGRIDLGFANGRPSLEIAGYLLNRPKVKNNIYESFLKNVASTCTLFKNDLSDTVSPSGNEVPELWLLGTSYNQISLAEQLGIGFSRSLFHTNDSVFNNLPEVSNYTVPSGDQQSRVQPLNLAFSGLCDQNNQRARRRFYDMYKFDYDPAGNTIVGCPEYFNDRLCEMQEKTGVKEFIFKDLDKDNDYRLKTLKSLSGFLNT